LKRRLHDAVHQPARGVELERASLAIDGGQEGARGR
jgi:hypothetical protein